MFKTNVNDSIYKLSFKYKLKNYLLSFCLNLERSFLSHTFIDYYHFILLDYCIIILFYCYIIVLF